MSVALYDDALQKKLERWTKDTSVTILTPSETKELFSITADLQNDKPLKLPLIALRRASGFSLLSTAKRPLSFDGATLDATHEKASQLNGIPISIPYQIDVYTRYQHEADEYIRNLVFNIINFPKIEVCIPYNNENYIHDSNIRLNTEVADNSDIPERLISGQFTRMSLSIYVDDAYLWDVRYRDVYSIETEVYIEDNKI